MADFCYECGKPTLDIFVCDRCGKDCCEDCYDQDDELCLKCMQEQ